MIRINLLPEEFRVQEKKSQRLPVIQIGIGTAVVMVILTLFFYFDFLSSSARLAELEKEWQGIQPQALVLNKLRSEVEGVLKPEKDFIERYVDNVRPLAKMLEWNSEFLPVGAWLTEVKLEHDDKGLHFLVKGLCLPLKGKTAIEQIEAYAQSLKNKMPKAQLNLTTTRQSFEDVQLVQFVMRFSWVAEKAIS